jgi:UDP-N-acetylmuramoylalanine--D-glutamate ligase
MAAAIGISHKDIRTALQSFKTGAHRIEQVGISDGVLWIDDSKATNPHAAAASILSHLSVIWIAGGVAKGAKMSDLVERVVPRVKAVILIGSDRDLIAREVAKFAPEIPVVFLDTPPNYLPGTASNEFMEEIVRQAHQLSASGDAILLAPACASMDQFLSYADRGDRFQQAVKKVILNEQ